MVFASDQRWSCTRASTGHLSRLQADQYGSSSSSSSSSSKASSPGGSSTGSSSGCSPQLQVMLSQEMQSYRTDHTADSGKLCAFCRTQLVDWMVKAAHSTELQLEDGTLHLAVDMLDRFLSAVLTVCCSEGQLVGAACLWLASKYEEVNPCTMNDMCWLTSSVWTQQQLRDMEHDILVQLEWRVALPTACTILSQLLADTDAGAIAPVCHLSAYLLEISLLCDDLLTVLPSCRAAASLHLARAMLGFNRSSWDSADSGYAAATSYREIDLIPVAASIAIMHRLVSQTSSSSKLTGSREHFAGEARMRVTVIPSMCDDLVLAEHRIPKEFAGRCCSKQEDQLWQELQQHIQQLQQQQQSSDWQQHRGIHWPWQRQHQQQFASWSCDHQHAQHQCEAWLQQQQQQQQAHAYWASMQSVAYWLQQQQLQSCWYQHHQQPLYWTLDQQQEYKPPQQQQPQQQQQQQQKLVSPWGDHYLPCQLYSQGPQQLQQQAAYAPAAEYAAPWPHYYSLRPAWIAAAAEPAAAEPAPTTPSRTENAAGAAEMSSAGAKMTAARAAGRCDASPATPADVDDLLAALCRAVEELHASMCRVASTNELLIARLCLYRGCHMTL